MKNLLLFLLMVSSFLTVTAQDFPNQTQRRLVENTIELYFDGWATGDTAKLGKAMHFSCRLKNFRDGKFLEYDKATYLGFFKPRPRPQNLQTRIVSIDITDIIGSAKVEIITEKDVFTDYFNLMKTGEGWFIMDKVSVRKSKTSDDVPPPIKSESNVKPEKEIVLENLKRPWSIAFLTEDEALVAEKEGDLVKVNLSTKQKVIIKGFPDDRTGKRVEYSGENDGLFEVLIDPNFNENKFVYVSYAARNEQGTATKVIRGVLENDSLSQVQTIFTATPYTAERYHYGGGMTFGRDGKLYLTVGERLFREIDEPPLPIAQNVEDKRGKIYRLNPDGSVPKDNPDFGAKAVPGLYALGIRAAQGITVEPGTNKIWFTEHGTHQGDEINVLNAGANYGWSIKTTGKYRSADYVPPQPSKDTVFTDPAWFWLQTVAPTGLVFYTGNEFTLWKNDLFVGGLAKGSLWRFKIEGETIKGVEELFVDNRVRLRKAAQSPAGKLYVLTDEMNGKVIRIKNAKVK
ncbi:MAG TPA: PQQ-dependent sugar dehydrogenase [Pyrinomonadaceae bacterium]